MSKGVFLDRDGVLNKVIFREGNYQKPIAPWNLEEFKLIPSTKKPLHNLKKEGYLLFVITNQPDIAKGIIDYDIVHAMNEIIINELPIDDIKVCHHLDNDQCMCRKPKPGMITDLSKKWDIDCKESFLIGDSWKDIEAGKSAGSQTILLDRTYNREVKAEYRINDLGKAVELIHTFS